MLVLALPLAFAQDMAPGAQPGQSGGNDQPAMHDRMHRPPMGNRGEWGAMGQHWGHGRQMMHRWGRGHRPFMLARLVNNPTFRERLGITPEQALKIRTQTSDFRKKRIRNRAELQVKRIELHDLLSADKPDRSAIDKKLQEISAVRLDGARSAVDFHLAMREALTPEQRQKLQQMREEFFRHGAPGWQRPTGPRAEMSSPDA
jgi:Spy/CpxP family protein refolding chaperone